MSFVQELNPNILDDNLEGQFSPHDQPSIAYDQNTIFVDAGCFPNGSTCWGLVAYDQPDSVIFAACRFENIDTDPMLAETLGIRWALQLAKDHGMVNVTIVFDAAAVVQCINSATVVAAIDPIIQDCHLLMSDLNRVNVIHVNVVAHNLVGLSKYVGSRTWLGMSHTI